MSLTKPQSGRDRFFILLTLILAIYTCRWIILALNQYDGSLFTQPINMIVFIVTFVLYLLRFRNNNIFCFELIFIPCFFVSFFYDGIIDASQLGVLLPAFRSNALTNPELLTKSACLNMVGYLCFLWGLAFANRKEYSRNNKFVSNEVSIYGVNVSIASRVVCVMLLILIAQLAASGAFNSWFYYGGDYQGEIINIRKGTLTCLVIICTYFEFLRLNTLKVHSFKVFILSVNKLYLGEIILLSLLLLLSGNRGDAMYIFMPPLVAYTVLIHKIRSSYILIGIAAGVLIMGVLGRTRVGESFVQADGIYTFIRDFGAIKVDCDYLIHYCDLNGPNYLNDALPDIISGIPFLGGKIVNLMGYEASGSPVIATEGLQIASATSGLGTSLVGDLYYCGKTPLTIIGLFLLGYLVSYLYNILYIYKSSKSWEFVLYLLFMSNCAYYIRDMWHSPLPLLVYEMTIIVCIRLLISRRLSTNT